MESIETVSISPFNLIALLWAQQWWMLVFWGRVIYCLLFVLHVKVILSNSFIEPIKTRLVCARDFFEETHQIRQVPTYVSNHFKNAPLLARYLPNQEVHGVLWGPCNQICLIGSTRSHVPYPCVVEVSCLVILLAIAEYVTSSYMLKWNLRFSSNSVLLGLIVEYLELRGLCVK